MFDIFQLASFDLSSRMGADPGNSGKSLLAGNCTQSSDRQSLFSLFARSRVSQLHLKISLVPTGLRRLVRSNYIYIRPAMQAVAKKSLSEFYPKLFLLSVLLCLGLGVATPNARATEDRDSSLSPGESGCPLPALERLKLHRVASGETIASIAQQYELLPATLLGMNPVLRRGEPSVGTEILIPPYNGIRLRLQPGDTFEEVARKYNVRVDVLYEVNGCQLVGDEIFVTGINWSPLNPSNAAPPRPPLWVIPGYPLASKGGILLAYGPQLRPGHKVAFHSGIDIYAEEGTPVLAAGDGVVVFAGDRGAYGNLVVINHEENKQTRYAHLQGFSVQSGQRIRRGDRIGTVGSTGRPDLSEPHLHFEVRSGSQLGWVAENPEVYLR